MNSVTEPINILNIPFGEYKMVREQCYPYLAYINGEGNPCGKMFDSFMLDFSDGDTMACWESGFDSVFAPEGGICELDSAVGDLKSLLGIAPQISFDIYVKAPIPQVSLKPFGDINGDGITEKLLDVEDCQKAFALFVSYFRRNFEIAKYKNLNLKGWILEPCEKAAALPSCVEYLLQKGESVFTSGIESLCVSADGVLLKTALDSAVMRVFYPQSPDLVISCAFSQSNALRSVYDAIFRIISPKGYNPAPVVKNIEPTPAPAPVVDEPAVAETPVADEPSMAEEKIAAEEKVATEEEPATITIEQSSADEHTPEREVSIEITIENTKQPEEKAEKTKCCVAKLTKKQKNALLGAGIAAATLGIAYLVGKFNKD